MCAAHAVPLCGTRCASSSPVSFARSRRGKSRRARWLGSRSTSIRLTLTLTLTLTLVPNPNPDPNPNPNPNQVLHDHLEKLHTNRGIGAGPDERMHGGLSPFNTLVWPVSEPMPQLVTR